MPLIFSPSYCQQNSRWWFTGAATDLFYRLFGILLSASSLSRMAFHCRFLSILISNSCAPPTPCRTRGQQASSSNTAHAGRRSPPRVSRRYNIYGFVVSLSDIGFDAILLYTAIFFWCFAIGCAEARSPCLCSRQCARGLSLIWGIRRRLHQAFTTQYLPLSPQMHASLYAWLP